MTEGQDEVRDEVSGNLQGLLKKPFYEEVFM